MVPWCLREQRDAQGQREISMDKESLKFRAPMTVRSYWSYLLTPR